MSRPEGIAAHFWARMGGNEGLNTCIVRRRRGWGGAEGAMSKPHTRAYGGRAGIIQSDLCHGTPLVQAEQERGATKAAACFALPPAEFGAPRTPTNNWSA